MISLWKSSVECYQHGIRGRTTIVQPDRCGVERCALVTGNYVDWAAAFTQAVAAFAKRKRMVVRVINNYTGMCGINPELWVVYTLTQDLASATPQRPGQRKLITIFVYVFLFNCALLIRIVQDLLQIQINIALIPKQM